MTGLDESPILKSRGFFVKTILKFNLFMRQLKITTQITLRESEAFNKYLADVTKTGDILTTEEELELALRIQQGDEKAINLLVEKNLRFVISVAKQYVNRGARLEDLVNEGNIGLIIAANRFDPSRGFKFISFAVWWIRQSIINYLANNSRSIRLPLNKVGDLTKINSAVVFLEQKLDREPTIDEITKLLGDKFNSNYIENAIAVGRGIFSLDSQISENDENSSLMDIIENEDSPQSDEELKRNDLKIKIKQLLSTLKFTERYIIIKYFGLDGKYPKTLSEIGEELELTRERIRQIKVTALRKLNSRAKSRGINEFL